MEVPLRFVINGAAHDQKVTLKDNELSLQGYAIPIDKIAEARLGTRGTAGGFAAPRTTSFILSSMNRRR